MDNSNPFPAEGAAPTSRATSLDDSGYAYSEEERPEMRALIPFGAQSLLDVGCGWGAFGRALVRDGRNLRLVGVEPYAEAANEAASHYDHVSIGQFPDDAPDETFDVIVFNDVLEHMYDPWKALAEAQRFLCPGGTIIASVPNARYLPFLIDLTLRGRWEYTDTGVLDRTHIRFFTRDSMVRMFVNSGFVVDQALGINEVQGSWKIKLLKPFLRRSFDELRYLQFAIVARQSSDRRPHDGADLNSA